MTSTAISTAVRPVRVIDIEDTVTINLPSQPTVRITPPPRRPRLDVTSEQPPCRPRTIGVVDEPLVTGQLPALAQYVIDRHRPVVPSYAARLRHSARHGACRPGLVAWLLGLVGRGRRDGA